MTRVIVSGFEPQWGLKKTPSGELAKLWIDNKLELPGIEVKGIVLPQIFGQSFEILQAEAYSFQPDLILMFGATQHESPIRIERFAINIINTAMGDNTRVRKRDINILKGPPAYETNLPVWDLVDHLKQQNIMVVPSYHAGTHCCNELFYRMMHWLESNPLNKLVRAGFIHCAFPNSFGVSEDINIETPNFEEITRSCVEAIKFLTGNTETYG